MERVLATEVQRDAALSEPPTVEVHGVPFLTQALAGRYERVDVMARDVPAGDVAGSPLKVSRLSATLHGARVPLSDVLTSAVTTVPVERVDADVLLPFDVVQTGSRVADLEVAPEGDLLRLRGTVRVLGQSLSGSALSRLTVDGGQLVVTAESFDVAGRGLDRLLTRALAGRFDVRLSVGALPYGLRVTGVDVREDGLAVTARADDAVLSAPVPS